jgi:hypothetical protein
MLSEITEFFHTIISPDCANMMSEFTELFHTIISPNCAKMLSNIQCIPLHSTHHQATTITAIQLDSLYDPNCLAQTTG